MAEKDVKINQSIECHFSSYPFRFSQNLKDLLNTKDKEGSDQPSKGTVMKRTADHHSDECTFKKSPRILSSGSESEEDKWIDPSDVLSDCFLLDDTEIT